jgi:acyl-CoA thioester hydrolase
MLSGVDSNSENNFMKEYIYPLRIYYEDTDFNGFVYFANYLKYMERASTHYISEQGIKATDLKAIDALIAVRSVKCDYIRPAKLDDDIEVVTTVSAYTNVNITFEYTIRSQKDPNLVYCRATIERLCVNHALQPIKIPQKLLAILN